MIGKPSILIAGGTGFIGKNLLYIARNLGWKCTVLSLRNPKKYEKNVDYIQVDLTDVILTKSLLADRTFDYVVNLSGYIDHSSYFDKGKAVIDAHFNGLQNLVNSLDRSNLKCFVQVGSSDEYGNVPAPQSEHMRESPISPYSFSKVSATHLLQMLYKTENFPSVILRLFLVYGEGQNGQRFLPQIIYGCINDLNFPVSDGMQLRDFCHVEDISYGIIAALTSDKGKGEVINLASGAPVTVREVITKVQSIIGLGKPIFGKIPYRTGENMNLYADVSKACRTLQWANDINLDKGLERTIHYYQNICK
jgi:nucleoside-diphosphate-sugar epimerase